MAAIQSLQNLPFSNLIGGPLVAAVQAQAQAAQTSIKFIEAVGFDQPATAGAPRPVKNVTFQYQKNDDQGTNRNFNLTVPILAIVPIPYLRIEELNIDFTAKLNDMIASDDQNTFSWGLDFDAEAKWGWGRANLRATFAGEHTSTNRSSSSAEYTMNVKVRAVQAEVPGGLARVIDIMESAITEKQTTQTQLTS